ncbi:hypothetical protein [Paenibacillus sp. N3.4]|uniref:hypothetical protein n=1 Tax=Paenibacillus sp. N3.4 TaxID=2603222 RepID=UPI0011C9448F|nr:hypothetical protein [Paenibacillus sp. N3.4]TXK84467.1 hypothetical protein FU659_08600 [Paenibacillus sp. N3.4]
MNYHPQGMHTWDAWYWPAGDVVHAFYLQRKRPDSTRTDREADSIGHAISTNLVDWEELPNVLEPGEPGSLEDLTLYTGCTFENEGKYYLYYTMRSSTDNGLTQRIGVAFSDDLYSWSKYEGNPVIVPDPRWYNGIDNPAQWGIVDCRDLVVVSSPYDDGFYGFYAARIPSEETPEGAVIACVYSRDLLTWEHRPPAFAPGKYAIVEVPDVFWMDGKWYMTCLLNNMCGNRNQFPGQPELTMGTIYAVSDRIEGPYVEQEDNILLASRGFNGLSCRSLIFKGERYVLYTQTERLPRIEGGQVAVGSIATPKKLQVVEGKLGLFDSDMLGKRTAVALLGAGELPVRSESRMRYETGGRWSEVDGRLEGEVRTSWCRYSFDFKVDYFILEAIVRLNQGAAIGLTFRQNAKGAGSAVLFDYDRQMVTFGDIPMFRILDGRQVKLIHGIKYHIKIIAKAEYIEVYMNDLLILQFVSYTEAAESFGLLVDRGSGSFENIRLSQIVESDVDE